MDEEEGVYLFFYRCLNHRSSSTRSHGVLQNRSPTFTVSTWKLQFPNNSTNSPFCFLLLTTAFFLLSILHRRLKPLYSSLTPSLSRSRRPYDFFFLHFFLKSVLDFPSVLIALQPQETTLRQFLQDVFPRLRPLLLQ